MFTIHFGVPLFLETPIWVQAMKDDRQLLERLLQRDGRALRYASRRLRGDRPHGGKNPNDSWREGRAPKNDGF